MCTWERLCAALHVVFSLAYVIVGAIQLVAGIFFLISLPVFKLGSNIWTGTWNIVMGISCGMLACIGELSAKRQETILYFAVSVLLMNVVNIVVLEVGEWHYFMADDVKKIISQANFKRLVFYAHISTSVTTLVAIGASFLDSHISFCGMGKRKSNPKCVHESVSDVEYIIPRDKTNSIGKQSHNLCNQYSQSWVYDVDAVGTQKSSESPYLKLCNSEPKHLPNSKGFVICHTDIDFDTISDDAEEQRMFVVNPTVHVEAADDDSTSNRSLNNMKTFSRTPSPGAGSSSSSPDSSSNPPIYECLEKLTEPSIYRSRLDTALSLTAEQNLNLNRSPGAVTVYHDENVSTPKVGRVIRPRSETFIFGKLSAAEEATEQVQYASLMHELQNSFLNRSKTKEQSGGNAENECDTKCVAQNSMCQSVDKKNSDAEFSQELEAALQLIQDLESPNNAEAPSAKAVSVKWCSDGSEEESQLTVSESVSPVEEINGKRSTVLYVNHGSLSSSGYSSPNLDSKTASMRSSSVNLVEKHQSPSSCVISSDGNTSIIILNPKNDYAQNLSRSDEGLGAESMTDGNLSIECVNAYVKSSESEKNYKVKDSKLILTNEPNYSSLSWKMLSLLNKRKKKHAVLCPELEKAIIKSESLAYLTESELLERFERNISMQRQIEQRVQQRRMSPSESQC